MLEAVKRDGVDLIAVPELERVRGITVAFTGRTGGKSSYPFDSLNLSYDVGDEREVVTSNRRLVGSMLGVHPDDWILCQQVHGCRVAHAGELERGRGGTDQYSAVPGSDGLVTDRAGLAIAVLTADCLPLVIVGGSGRTICVAHMGWRGALYGVAGFALRRLLENDGCSPGEVTAFLGPHIGACCLEVGQELAELFIGAIGPGSVIDHEGGNPRIDLTSICIRQLTDYGVEISNIFPVEICTVCNEKYFSYRHSGGITGRQTGIVAIL